MKWVLLAVFVFIVFVIYKIIKRVVATSGNSAQSEIKKPISEFLQKGGTNDECSYSIWFIIDEWTNNEKKLFTKTSSIDVKKHQEVETYYIENYTTGETGLYNPVGTYGTTGGVTGTYDFVYDDMEYFLNFEVSFDNYVNNMNIFLPELNNSYSASNNCKINGEMLGDTGYTGTFDNCKTMCSNYNFGFNTCNSFTYSSGASEASGSVYFAADFDNGVNFEGNQPYDYVMGYDTLGKCYLYSSSPVMPKNCFSGMTGKVSPYPVYDWGDFIYSNGFVSYVKEKCSIPIPLQKWTNLIITIKSKIMEIYINGKLVKSCPLTKNIDNQKDSSGIFTITPNGYGFNGSTMKFNYWEKCLTSSEISNLSKKVS